MKAAVVVAVAVCAAGPGAARAGQPQSDAGRIETSAIVELEGAWTTGPAAMQKLEVVVDPELTVALSPRLRLVGIGRFRADLVDGLEPGDWGQPEVARLSRPVLFGDRTELELRELHVRAELGRTAVSAGKQQIVWGQADGLKVLDVVNPQDFREFILDDFERSRIPLWSTAVETPIGGATLQLIWVPDHSYHHFPPPGSPFDLTARTLPASLPDGVRVEVHPIERPHRVFRDSDVGGRLSTFWKGWDLTANYLYHYDDRPVLTGSISLASDGPHLMLTPRYERAHLVGGSFSNAFGPLTVRGELAMLVKRAFRRDELESPGPVRASELDWVIGFDWLGIRETLLSLQVFQTLATNESTPLAPGQTGTTLSLLVRREWLNDRLTADTMWLHGVTLGDGVVRPRLGYELGNDIRLWIGADVFYGNAAGVFGEFGERDRILLGVGFGF